MIFLKIEDYCENCPDFEADVEKMPGIFSNSKTMDVVNDTYIKCKNRNRCRVISNYLEKEKEDVND